MKALISTLALVVTLSGWARLATVKRVLPGDLAVQSAPAPLAPSAPAGRSVDYRVAPIPTLVPLIAAQHLSVHRSPGLAQPAPAAQAPALTTLRMVSAPAPAPAQAQAPVAVSRSSR
ncbi:MAG: hypothetical protein U0470_10480 [Anaerolineae bacterium]